MKVTPRAEALTGEPMDRSHFHGGPTAVALHRTEAAHPVSVALVRFKPGERTHWHRHAGGQALHVVEVEGWVQSRGQTAQPLSVGDSVSAAPGEEHWHGAGHDSAIGHVAVSIGETEWLEPSPSA